MLTRYGARFPLAFKVSVTALSAAFAITFASAFSAGSTARLTAAIGVQQVQPRVLPHHTARYTFPVNPFSKAAAVIHAKHLAHLAYLAKLEKEKLARLAKEKQEKQAAEAAAYARAHPPKVQTPPSTRAAAPAAASYAGSNAMQQCIIRAESGGNPNIWNATGHWGLYQFSYGTWVAHGGVPADFGHAGIAEQNQVYYNTVAADGYSDWAPYDGC